MKSFKRAVYKTGEIEEEIPKVSCNDTIVVNGAEGIYEVEINVGDKEGTAGVTYNAFSVPDRFQIFYDGNLVADSKFVGNLPYFVPFLEEVVDKELPIFKYNGSRFIDSGTTEVVTVVNSDIASGIPSEPLSGDGRILFNKNKSTVRTMTLRVYGVLGSTIWNATPICPYIPTNTSSPTTPPKPKAREYIFVYQQYTTGNCLDMDAGNAKTVYSSENLVIGAMLYDDKQLMKKASSGEYWLGKMIHRVVSGKIEDIYPCSTLDKGIDIY